MRVVSLSASQPEGSERLVVFFLSKETLSVHVSFSQKAKRYYSHFLLPQEEDEEDSIEKHVERRWWWIVGPTPKRRKFPKFYTNVSSLPWLSISKRKKKKAIVSYVLL
jgi:hypothetical protein